MRAILILYCMFPLLLVAQVEDTNLYRTTEFSPTRITTIFPIDSLAWRSKLDTALDLGLGRKHLVKDFFSDYPNPNRALIASLIFPGGGQIYNGAFWKVPLVYGAYGTVITLIETNRRQYRYFATQYFNWVNNQNSPFVELVVDDFIRESYSQPSEVKVIRDKILKRKEYSWIALFGVTLLSVADAFVDCHLKDFDVSDDLSFKWKPVLINTPSWGNVAGLGLVIPLVGK